MKSSVFIFVIVHIYIYIHVYTGNINTKIFKCCLRSRPRAEKALMEGHHVRWSHFLAILLLLLFSIRMCSDETDWKKYTYNTLEHIFSCLYYCMSTHRYYSFNNEIFWLRSWLARASVRIIAIFINNTILLLFINDIQFYYKSNLLIKKEKNINFFSGLNEIC